MMKFSEKHKC
jgi:hypothetical protein